LDLRAALPDFTAIPVETSSTVDILPRRHLEAKPLLLLLLLTLLLRPLLLALWDNNNAMALLATRLAEMDEMAPPGPSPKNANPDLPAINEAITSIASKDRTILKRVAHISLYKFVDSVHFTNKPIIIEK